MYACPVGDALNKSNTPCDPLVDRSLDLFKARLDGAAIPDIAKRRAATVKDVKRGLKAASKAFSDPSTSAQIAIEHSRLDRVFEGLLSGEFEPAVASALVKTIECRIKLLMAFAKDPSTKAPQDPGKLDAMAREFIAEREAKQTEMPWLNPEPKDEP